MRRALHLCVNIFGLRINCYFLVLTIKPLKMITKCYTLGSLLNSLRNQKLFGETCPLQNLNHEMVLLYFMLHWANYTGYCDNSFHTSNNYDFPCY